jgi:hypothetical protein
VGDGKLKIFTLMGVPNGQRGQLPPYAFLAFDVDIFLAGYFAPYTNYSRYSSKFIRSKIGNS